MADRPLPPGSTPGTAFDYARERDDARRAAWREGINPRGIYSHDGTEFDPSEAEGL